MRLSPVFSGVVLLMVLSACGPAIPNVGGAKRVTLVYDPATGNLPAPNDLALSKGVVAIAENPLLSETENQLKLGFNGRNGFSTGSSSRVAFSGPLSAASITDKSVVAFDLGDKGKGPIVALKADRVYAACDSSITLSSPTGLLPGHVYLFAARGGTDGLKGESGEEVVESPAFHYLRAGKNLNEHVDAMPGATLEIKKATAAKLEAVRQGLEPLFQVLEAQGLARRDVVGLWHFTVLTNGEAAFDPGSKRLPFPNDLLKDGATGLVSVPIDPADKPEQQTLKKGFNELDGFSTTAAWSVESTLPIDRATVTATTVRAFERDSKKEITELDRVLSTDGKKLVLQVKSPLLGGTAYVVVLAGVKDVQGNVLSAMPLGAVLSLSKPLVDPTGKSLMSNFCTETAQKLEPIRSGIAAVLEANKIDRATVSAAWSFTTQDILKRARELWNTPYSKSLPLTLSNVVTTTPVSLNIAKKVTGTFTTWDRMDPTTRGFRASGLGENRQIEFVLWIPKGVPSGGKTRVVVIGHGLTSDRNMAGPLSERLAASGFATMAIDFPLHGERTVCTKDSHCASGAVCASDGQCMKNGQKADFALLSGIAIAGFPGARVASLDAWVDVANLMGTRDHFRQAVIDLSAQTRLIREADFKPYTGGVALDGTDINYAGISLGGIMGGIVSGIDPHFKAMLLNVGGADLVDLIRDSSTFGPTLKSGLADKGIEEGTPAYEQFVNAARWALDEIDPLNLAPYAFVRPLKYVDPKTGEQLTAKAKKLRLQMAIGDLVVPNSATERLVTCTGINKATEFRSFVDPLNHVFLINPLGLGQSDMANFLEAN